MDPLDRWGHWGSERLSYLPHFAELTGRWQLEPGHWLQSSPGSHLCGDPSPRQERETFKTVSESVKPQLESGGGMTPEACYSLILSLPPGSWGAGPCPGLSPKPCSAAPSHASVGSALSPWSPSPRASLLDGGVS